MCCNGFENESLSQQLPTERTGLIKPWKNHSLLVPAGLQDAQVLDQVEQMCLKLKTKPRTAALCLRGLPC